MSPASGAAETALIVIAIAVSLQTVLSIGAVVAAFVMWRRAHSKLEESYLALSSRLDDVVLELREAATSVNRLSDRASNVVGDAGDMVRNIATVVAAPRSLLVAGAASAASRLFSSWRRRRAAVRP